MDIAVITDSYASGAVNGGDGDFDRVGGLMGSESLIAALSRPAMPPAMSMAAMMSMEISTVSVGL